MRKKMGFAIGAFLLALTLAACGNAQGSGSATAESQAVVSAAQEESSQPSLKPQPRTLEEAPAESGSSGETASQQAALVLVQEDSGAEAGYEPAFTLYPDGTFELFVSFYDGTATITGTYTEQDGGYVLTPSGSTAQGAMGSDVGEMTLSPEGEGYAYSGGQLGVIFDGAVFAPSQG